MNGRDVTSAMHRPTRRLAVLLASSLLAGCTCPSKVKSERKCVSIAKVDAPPTRWPAEKPWKPRRHFGPFQLHSPRLRIDAQFTRWFFGDEFDNSPDRGIFARYFRPTLPSNDFETPRASPVQTIPGELPQPGELHDTLFELTQVRWSSLFGGSIALELQALETFEFDLRSDEFLIEGKETNPLEDDVAVSLAWDLRPLTMTLYVTPSVNAINAAQNNGSAIGAVAPRMGVVLQYQVLAAYRVERSLDPNQGQQPLRIVKVEHDPVSQKALAALTVDLERKLGAQQNVLWPASLYAHGFLHSQFQSELGPGNLARMIEMDDDYAAVLTQPGNPTLLLSARARISSDTWGAGDQFDIEVRGLGRLAGGDLVEGGSASFRNLDENEFTGWVPCAEHLLSELQDGIAQQVEMDAGWHTDVWDTLAGRPTILEEALLRPVRFDIPIDVAALNARQSRGAFGTVAQQLLQSSVIGSISLSGDTNSNPEEGVREIEFQLRLLMR